MNEIKSVQCPYRSPKTAARAEAQLLRQGEVARDLEYTSQYDATNHLDYPRVIETKPARFAIAAVLIDKVGDAVFEGIGTETRLPAIAKTRDTRVSAYKTDQSDTRIELMQMADEWFDIDISQEISDVINDPQNTDLVDKYDEIVLDIATASDNDSKYLGADNAKEVLQMRMNLGASIEMDFVGTAMIRWAMESPVVTDMTPDERRLFIISLLPFAETMSQLESTHADRYTYKIWSDTMLTMQECGVELVQDANGNYMYKNTETQSKPERTFGRPIGCPAGFTIESVAASGLGNVVDSRKETIEPKQTVLQRALIAFVNEAYDRGILD